MSINTNNVAGKVTFNLVNNCYSEDFPEGITNHEALRQRMNEIGLVGIMTDMEFMIHVLNNPPEEYDVVLDSLETRLVSTGEDKFSLESLSEMLSSRFERIISKERQKDCNERALAAGFNIQFKGTCGKCSEYGHKSDSPVQRIKERMESRIQRVGIPRMV